MPTPRWPSLGLACLFALASQACAGWTESQLVNLGGTFDSDGDSHPVAINASGAIAGYGCIFDPGFYTDCFHGILWEPGMIKDLRGFDGYEAWAFGINDSGLVVGTSHPGGPWAPEGILWSSGTSVHLGALVYPTDINNTPQVVGSSRETSGPAHAVMWEDGDTTDLWVGTVVAINDSGHAVGNDATGAVIWRDARMYALGAFKALDINFKGQVLGRRFSDGRTILWENGTITDIGLGPEYEMVRMNDDGLIVGKKADRAIAWEGGTTYDLGAGHAEAVNNARQIVGYGPWPVGPWTMGALIWNPL